MLTKESTERQVIRRYGKSGEWKTELAPESVATIESAWGKLIEPLGYALMSGCKEVGIEAISHQETRL